jgi:hypothetical protein
MVYGKQKVFDADRLIDLLNAFESFTVAAGSARGGMDELPAAAAAGSSGRAPAAAGGWQQPPQPGGLGGFGGGGWPGAALGAPLAALLGPSDGAAAGAGSWLLGGLGAAGAGAAAGGGGGGGIEGPRLFGNGIGLFGLPANRYDVRQGSGALDSQGRLREALRFVFSQARRGFGGLGSR